MNHNLQNDFEKFIRREMEGLDQYPADSTWNKIAAQQQPRNTWLQVRYYGKFALPIAAAVILAVSAFLWRPLSNKDHLSFTNAPDRAFIQAFFMPAAAENGLLSPVRLPMASATAAIPWKQPTNRANGFPSWYPQNNVPVDRIRFIAEEGMRYQSPVSGNSVTIPANSLVYANGAPVQGEVELFFREYRTIPDILAADIPMHYTDQRGDFFFNSGGMFDIRVNQNDEALFMAPGQAYDVDFKANKNLSNTSLFYFDEKKNNWDFVSGEAFDENAGEIRTFDVRQRSATDQPLPVISDQSTVAKENTRANADDPCLPALPSYPKDADQVQWVKDAIKLGNDLTYGKRTIPKWFKLNPKGTDGYFALAMDRSEIELVFGADNNGTRFFPQDINGVFTEFTALKNCYFLRTSDTLSAVQAQAGSSGVDAIFNNTALWSSVELMKDEGDKCFLVLRQPKGDAIKIHAKICSSSEEGKDIHFNPDAVMNEYAALRAQRLANMSKELQELRQFMVVSTMFQQDKEWCLPQKEWLTYFEDNNGLMRARYDALIRAGMLNNDPLVQNRLDEWAAKSRSLVFDRYNRGAGSMNTGQKLASLLQLSGFGVYNCDQIYRLVLTVNFFRVNASFRTAAGTPVYAASIRILDEATRMFFSMEKNDMMYALPGRTLEVMVTDKAGRIFYMPGTEYGQINFTNKKSVVFTVKEITEKVQSPMGWAEVLQI